MENKEEEILKAAESMVREGGYNSFSFRDIASAVGVKSSSVHYHFPTKADLGAAVAGYYTNKFLSNLGDPVQLIADGTDPIKVYVRAFKGALTKDKRMCLCGMLGAEIDGLPSKVAVQTKIFFERNIEWLTIAYASKGLKKGAKTKAMQTLSLLEGAMITSKVLMDVKVFDKITELLNQGRPQHN
jgi:TetR/AcrR family transcriptional repressor of nem operon